MKKNQLTRFIAEPILAIVILLTGLLSKAIGQDTIQSSFGGDTLVYNGKYTLKYFTGVTGVTHFPIKNTKIKSFFNLRTGLISSYNLTKNLKAGFHIMGNFADEKNTGFSNVCLEYKPGNFSFVVGKTASPITRIRPYPVSFNAMVEYASTSVLNANRYTFNTSYEFTKIELKLHLGAGEFGKHIGDSTQYSIKIDYKGFTMGVYSFAGKNSTLDKEVGLVGFYKPNDCFEAFASYKRKEIASYIQFVVSKKHNLYFGTDMIYDYAVSKGFAKSSDYLEILLLQFFDFGKIIQANVTGLYAVGITHEKNITLYMGMRF